MKALPFPCIRPVPEHAPAIASLPAGALTTRDELTARIEAGELVEDRNLSYYLYELATGGRVLSGIIAVCSLDACVAVSTSGEMPPLDEDAVRAEIERIRELGCQTSPVILTHPDQPVLEMIAGAAKTSAALYTLENGAGDRQTVWEVTRREAIDALHAMLEQVPPARVCGGRIPLEAAARVARDERERAQAAGTFTGKEPFNYVLAILVPESQAGLMSGGGELELPLGHLFAHRIMRRE